VVLRPRFSRMMLGSGRGNSIYRSITYSNSIQVGERALGDVAAQGQISSLLTSDRQARSSPPRPQSAGA